MIKLNLVPPSLRKGGGGTGNNVDINIPKETLMGVAAGVIVVIVAIHLVLSFLWLMQFGHLSFYKTQWNKLLPDKQALDGIAKETADFKKKISLVSGITTKNYVWWSPKFNAISDELPRGVWIKKMTLDKTGLTIEGSVVSKNRNEINNVGLFLSALRQNSNFMDGFSSLEVNSIQGAKNNAVDVTDFSVLAKLKA